MQCTKEFCLIVAPPQGADRPTTPLPVWTNLAWTYDGTPVFNGDHWPDTILPAPPKPLIGTMVHTGPPSLNYISTQGFFDYPQTVNLVVTVNGVTVLTHHSIIICNPGPTLCIGEKIFFALPQCSAATIVVSVSPGGTGTAFPTRSLPGGTVSSQDVLYEPPLFGSMLWGAPSIVGPVLSAIYTGKSGAYFLVFGASSVTGATAYNGPSINCKARVSNNNNADQWRVKVSIYTAVPGDGSTLLDVTGTDVNRDMDFTVPDTACVQKYIYVELFSTGQLADVPISFSAR